MVTVRKVANRRELRAFVDFPNKLYKGNPYFVPSTYADDLEDWDETKNPAFEDAEAAAFLALREGEIVGRIGVIYSRKANSKWKQNRARFTQVDFIDDPEVSAALFSAAEGYAKERGCEAIIGPLGFTDMDREGMLVEGFDRRSMFITYYNHPYYIEHLTRLGFVKETDWVEYLVKVPEQSDEKIPRLADLVQRKFKLKIAQCRTRKEIWQYVKGAFDLLNVAYKDLFGTTSLTDKQVLHYTNKFLPLIDPRYVCFVLDEQDAMIGFAVAAPSLAEAFRKCGGKLFPFGFLHVLRAMKGKNDTLDLFLIAVRPDYQGKGVNAILINEILKSAVKHGMRYAETGPELELNEKVTSQWRFFDVEQHKRRRCFIKQLQG